MGSLAHETTPFQVFSNRAATDGFMLKWWLNDTVVFTSSVQVAGAGTILVENTLGVASNSDACVVFINAWAGEGGDRSELRNEDQD